MRSIWAWRVVGGARRADVLTHHPHPTPPCLAVAVRAGGSSWGSPAAIVGRPCRLECVIVKKSQSFLGNLLTNLHSVHMILRHLKIYDKNCDANQLQVFNLS